MKDEAFLDSAGPVTIIAFVFLIVGIATWVMVEGGGDWGKITPQSVASTSHDAH